MSSSLTQSVFLIGFMGSGKSTYGKLLAKEFGVPFIDSDKEIVKKTGKSIPDFFEAYGESAFRKEEADFVKETDFSKPQIVSCGGGLPCFNGLIDELKQKGKVVFLDVSLSELIHRLGQNRQSRPLLANLNDEELSSAIETRLLERLPVFQQAHLTLKIDSGIKNALVIEQLKELILEN